MKFAVSYADNGEPSLVTSDFAMSASGENVEFRLQSYPHRLQRFKRLLRKALGVHATHRIFGDFKPLTHLDKPSFYIHVIEKPE